MGVSWIAAPHGFQRRVVLEWCGDSGAGRRSSDGTDKSVMCGSGSCFGSGCRQLHHYQFGDHRNDEARRFLDPASEPTTATTSTSTIAATLTTVPAPTSTILLPEPNSAEFVSDVRSVGLLKTWTDSQLVALAVWVCDSLETDFDLQAVIESVAAETEGSQSNAYLVVVASTSRFCSDLFEPVWYLSYGYWK